MSGSDADELVGSGWAGRPLIGIATAFPQVDIFWLFEMSMTSGL